MVRVIRSDGVECGRVSAGRLARWIAQGRANVRTLVRAEHQPDWRPLASHPELAAALSQPSAGTSGSASGGGTAPGTPEASVPNHLVWAILTTLFCCIPFGVPAIVYAAQVDGKVARGDIDGARESSRKARLWCSWGIGAGAAAYGLYLARTLLTVIG